MLLHSNSYAFASGKLFYHRIFALTAAYKNHTSLIIKPLQGNTIYIPYLHDNLRIYGRQSVSWKIIQPFPISELAQQVCQGIARHSGWKETSSPNCSYLKRKSDDTLKFENNTVYLQTETIKRRGYGFDS